MTSIQLTSPYLQFSSQQISQPDLQAITKSIQDILARAVKTLENRKSSYKQKSDNTKKIKKKFKTCKIKQKDTSTSDKFRNKLTYEQSFQKIMLNMLKKALLTY
ncbi:12730_t:CDS:2 [Ambispora leptoticha]|uniref:12730_t:CDS:1 n=1 Tax=Ambispora leptoticha TaxID=144679 RepID=A0A9N9AA38_9GLOM|nr:12730_t:CDS:2 [Ambispora leptoticha]